MFKEESGSQSGGVEEVMGGSGRWSHRQVTCCCPLKGEERKQCAHLAGPCKTLSLTLRKEAIPSQQWMNFSDKNILPHEKQIGYLICLEQKCKIDSIFLRTVDYLI